MSEAMKVFKLNDSERGSVSEIIDVFVLWYMLFSGLAILMLALMGRGRRQERER